MKTVGLVAVSLLASLLVGNAIVLHFAPGYLNDERPAWAIVFGADVRSDGVPYDETRERLAETLKLWNDGLVSRVLVSGGSRPEEVDETAAMANWLVARGATIGIRRNAPSSTRSVARAWLARPMALIETIPRLPRCLGGS